MASKFQRTAEIQKLLLIKKKHLFWEPDKCKKINDMPLPSEPNIREVYIPYAEPGEERRLKLKLGGFNEPAYLSGAETWEISPQIKKTFYTYSFDWKGVRYRFIGKTGGRHKKSDGYFYIRYELHKWYPYPHMHTIHQFPKYRFSKEMGFERFLNLIEEYFFKNKIFIENLPWERRSSI